MDGLSLQSIYNHFTMFEGFALSRIDLCHRFTVVVRGEALSIEYRDSRATESFVVHPGMADGDEPQPRAHRGINAGTVPYEEVIVFFVDTPAIEPQPTAEC